MNSKEALERLEKHFHLSCYSFDNNENSDIREYNTIKQDLERLEKLEHKAQKYDELCKHNVMESQSFGNDLIQGILVLNKRINDKNKNLRQENEKLKKAIEILKDKINSYLELLYSKEYFNEHIKGKYSTIGVANRNGQEKALRTILELLEEVL